MSAEQFSNLLAGLILSDNTQNGYLPRPSCEDFPTTFAAPPSVVERRIIFKIGTGASGEIRSMCPQRYSSNIKSPITAIRQRGMNLEGLTDPAITAPRPSLI